MKPFLEFLPAVLQFSILLFWIGLSLYLWSQARGSATASLAFATFGTAWYLLSLGVSVWNPFSPFETSLSSSLRAVPGLLSAVPGLLKAVPRLLRAVPSRLGAFFRRVFHFPLAFIVFDIFRFSAPLRRKAKNPPRSQIENPSDLDKLTSSCIEWSLDEVVDDDIALEATRLLTYRFKLKFIQGLTRTGNSAFHNLLIHFHRSIKTRTKSSMDGDSAFTYVTAVCHVLLALRVDETKPQMFTSILQVLHNIEEFPLELQIFNSILAELCERNSDNLYIPHTPIADILFDGPFEDDHESQYAIHISSPQCPGHEGVVYGRSHPEGRIRS